MMITEYFSITSKLIITIYLIEYFQSIIFKNYYNYYGFYAF